MQARSRWWDSDPTGVRSRSSTAGKVLCHQHLLKALMVLLCAAYKEYSCLEIVACT